MPNQNDPTQNQNPLNSPTAPPTIFPQSDLPPLPPAFQNMPKDELLPSDNSNGSAAPPDVSSIIPKANPPAGQAKKKFGGGRIIATILGLIVLVGGVGAGIVLTQQKQLLQQKAAVTQEGGAGGTTVADGQCLGPGQTCTSGKSYSDNSCAPTDTRCGIKQCATGLTCSRTNAATGSTPCLSNNNGVIENCCPSGQIIVGSSCVTPSNNPNPPACSTFGTGLTCGLAGGSAISGANYCSDATGNRYCCPSGKTLSTDKSSCITPAAGGGTTTQCTRVPTPAMTIGNAIPITQALRDTCNNACSGATLVASTFKCNGINLTVGCQDNGIMIGVPDNGQSIPVNTPSCGTVQTDVFCRNTANTWGNVAFLTKQAATACSTAGTAPPLSQPTTAPSCIAVSAYDASWAPIPQAQLPALTVGKTVNFCVGGNAPTGTFDKAQFMVDSVLKPETTTPRPGSGDFCQSYTISPTDTTINVKAKIHHAVSGWVGEAI